MSSDAQRPGIDRRRFLQLSTGAAATLALLGASAQLAACGRGAAAAAPGYGFLTAADLVLFGALLAPVNGPALPVDAELRAEALRRIDLACVGLEAPARAEARKLLELLHWAPFRRLACGVNTEWGAASAVEMTGFLARWRNSRVGLLNAGHRALTKLAALGWWSQPASWPSARYPGPPAWAVAALSA